MSEEIEYPRYSVTFSVGYTDDWLHNAQVTGRVVYHYNMYNSVDIGKTTAEWFGSAAENMDDLRDEVLDKAHMMAHRHYLATKHIAQIEDHFARQGIRFTFPIDKEYGSDSLR